MQIPYKNSFLPNMILMSPPISTLRNLNFHFYLCSFLFSNFIIQPIIIIPSRFHIVLMCTSSFFFYQNVFYLLLCFLWKRLSMVLVFSDENVFVSFLSLVNYNIFINSLCYILGAISHMLCVVNGINISNVFPIHFVYSFMYHEMKTNKIELNWNMQTSVIMLQYV